MGAFALLLSQILGPTALAQPVPTPDLVVDEAPEPDTGGQDPGRVLATADRDVVPRFRIWESERFGGFIKPVIQLSTAVVSFFPNNQTSEEVVRARTSTLALARFGFEGQLFEYLTFRTLFERNVGFTLSRGAGPIGTSIWEGTASIQARENYIRLSRWGVQVTGGIFPDPASVDYIASDTLDLFGMDPYVRDPLLKSGFNQGQGVMIRYRVPGLRETICSDLDFGLSFSAGNPLTSSLSFGFGGDVSTLGTLFSTPLRNLANGVPGSDIQMSVLTPSAIFTSRFFDIRTAAQVYFVDIDITESEDERLHGYNLRASLQFKPVTGLRIFGSGALRRNSQIITTDLSMTRPDFLGLLAAAGAEYQHGRFSVGGQYYWLKDDRRPGIDRDMDGRDDDQIITTQIVSLGMSYYLTVPNVAVGLRWSFNTFDDTTRDLLSLKSTHALILSMRLLI
ncbi:MAG: hypothetical protein AAGH15_16615 [Myxococcota bacterium]